MHNLYTFYDDFLSADYSFTFELFNDLSKSNVVLADRCFVLADKNGQKDIQVNVERVK